MKILNVLDVFASRDHGKYYLYTGPVEKWTEHVLFFISYKRGAEVLFLQS